MFDLEEKISEWRQQMLAAGIRAPVPLEELESHLREDVGQQMRSGLSAQHAFEAAVQRMGTPPVLSTEFVKVGRFASRRLVAFRPYMIVINLILGAVLTTPEVFTQILMFIPLQLLYEASIWIARYRETNTKKRLEN